MAKPDLKDMTRKQLERLQVDIDKALERLKAKEIRAARVAVEKTLKEHGFSLADITGTEAPVKETRKYGKKSAKNVAPKYMNLENKAETWTGRGRQPGWFKAAIAAGKTPADMSI